jgi:hypothetical protein
MNPLMAQQMAAMGMMQHPMMAGGVAMGEVSHCLCNAAAHAVRLPYSMI